MPPTNPMEQIRIDVAVLKRDVKTLERDLGEKHQENKEYQEGINGKMERILRELFNLRVKIAFYSGVAGVLTALVTKWIDHAIK